MGERETIVGGGALIGVVFCGQGSYDIAGQVGASVGVFASNSSVLAAVPAGAVLSGGV